MTSENPEEIQVEDSSFDDFIKKSYDAIKEGIKASNSFPSNDNFNYYTCFPTFNEVRNVQINKILDSMQTIVEKAGITGKIGQRDIEEKFDLILESNDIFLDQAALCMDEESGISKNPSVELIVSQTKYSKNFNGSWNTATNNKPGTSTSSAQTVRLLTAKNIQRPQLSFKDKIDNSQKPWYPKIKDKPNSLKPLAIYLECGDEGEEVFCHPYQFELDKFEPSEAQLTKVKPIKYKSIEETPLIIIEQVSDLKILLQDLENNSEIAVDLEHHSYRSFQGITCLMQISTRETDYLIDTLLLRSELHVLNEIFTKPSILKVFHGADSDILWLQRDLGLYVVNMFDTHQAAKQLGLPFLSLSYLLKIHCQIDANKHFQLADWRIRPLPEELTRYARDDTHYLLYIKDILNNELIDLANGQSNILKAVYTQSKEICNRTYTKPIWTEQSYLTMYRKSQKMLNNRQLYALQELHKWRDETARIEDDSTNYVLPNHMLINIAETLPREMQGILACCNPIPPLVRQNLLKIHKMILKAREQPLIKPILEEDMKQRLTQRNQVSNSQSWIFAPHDMPSGMEARANLPCLLNSSKDNNNIANDTILKPVIDVFDSSSEQDENDDTASENTRNKKRLRFISPFERYKLVQPMVVEEERKAREKEEQENAKSKNKLLSNQETVASINRVHDHFVKVVQEVLAKPTVSLEIEPTNKAPQGRNNSRFDNIVNKKNRYQTLNQMRGKKRKRQLSPEIVRPYKNAKRNNFDNTNKCKRR